MPDIVLAPLAAAAAIGALLGRHIICRLAADIRRGRADKRAGVPW